MCQLGLGFRFTAWAGPLADQCDSRASDFEDVSGVSVRHNDFSRRWNRIGIDRARHLVAVTVPAG
ncbi:hypothetical protein A5742_10950 [Mycolicibacterium fortuitum]|uniref:Uncharacterized protein n=1 Tax=Mycolicibacterium fortuitum TaxID=1766 RepID=A0ABD6QEY8_MYCFO|nr:hypothetical protein A5742_10950 [Mycolicibacterium fortuitum]